MCIGWPITSVCPQSVRLPKLKCPHTAQRTLLHPEIPMLAWISFIPGGFGCVLRKGTGATHRGQGNERANPPAPRLHLRPFAEVSRVPVLGSLLPPWRVPSLGQVRVRLQPPIPTPVPVADLHHLGLALLLQAPAAQHALSRGTPVMAAMYLAASFSVTIGMLWQRHLGVGGQLLFHVLQGALPVP